jgi:uncharacterized membrane protein YqiK
MSGKFDNQIEELNKLTDKTFIRKKFVHARDFESFKSSMENLNNEVSTLGNSELEQKTKECMEWVMERVNKWNMAVDNFHIVDKLKEVIPLLNELNSALAEQERLAEEKRQAEAAEAKRQAEAEEAKRQAEANKKLALAAERERLLKEKEAENKLNKGKMENFSKVVDDFNKQNNKE